MRILHIANNPNLSTQIKTAIRDRYNGYETVTFDELKNHEKNIDYYRLIIIEADCTSQEQCEIVLNKILEAKKYLVNTIIISHGMSVAMKEHLYDNGVMAIIDRDKIDLKRFRRYISSIESETQTIGSLKNMKIAVVDDSRFSLQVLQDFFDKSGIHTVDYYNDSEKFLNSDLKYDLYVIDLVMPVYDGEDVIHRIREQNNDGIIILVTQYGDVRAISHCLSIGADDFILKPLDFKLFMLRLSSCIKNYKVKKKNINKTNKLYQRATRDSLTGAYNRSYLKEKFSKEFLRGCKNGETFSVILFDLDFFKQINDEYGHQKGDLVLKGTADLVSKLIRKTDVLCRWGGEEFLILLPGAHLTEATKVAEKIRNEIEKLRVRGVKRITSSFGVTQCNADDTEDTIFKRVDNSLYLAKLTGRNKVVYNEEVYIAKGGVPVNIDWGPFFRSGNPQIDKEHEELISISNDIISNCFIEDNLEEILVMFKRLLDHVSLHFENEEAILLEHNYEEYEQHKKIHNDLVIKAKNMYDALEKGLISPIAVVKYVVQDVVVGHIIKSDFDFFELFNK